MSSLSATAILSQISSASPGHFEALSASIVSDLMSTCNVDNLSKSCLFSANEGADLSACSADHQHYASHRINRETFPSLPLHLEEEVSESFDKDLRRSLYVRKANVLDPIFRDIPTCRVGVTLRPNYETRLLPILRFVKYRSVAKLVNCFVEFELRLSQLKNPVAVIKKFQKGESVSLLSCGKLVTVKKVHYEQRAMAVWFYVLSKYVVTPNSLLNKYRPDIQQSCCKRPFLPRCYQVKGLPVYGSQCEDVRKHDQGKLNYSREPLLVDHQVGPSCPSSSSGVPLNSKAYFAEYMDKLCSIITGKTCDTYAKCKGKLADEVIDAFLESSKRPVVSDGLADVLTSAFRKVGKTAYDFVMSMCPNVLNTVVFKILVISVCLITLTYVVKAIHTHCPSLGIVDMLQKCTGLGIDESTVQVDHQYLGPETPLYLFTLVATSFLTFLGSKETVSRTKEFLLLLRPAGTLMEFFSAHTTKIVNYISYLLTGDEFLATNDLPSRITAAFRECQTVTDALSAAEPPYNKEFLSRLVAIEVDLIRLKSEMRSARYERRDLLAIQEALRDLEKAIVFAKGMLASCEGRTVPVTLLLRGAPCQGKSTIMNSISCKVYERLQQLYERRDLPKERRVFKQEKWDPTMHIKLNWSSLEDNRFEGYKNQFCVDFAEVFVSVEPTDQQRDCERLLSLVDNGTYFPPMAFEGKGVQTFTSDLLLFTTNFELKTLAVSHTMASIDATFRRFHAVYEVFRDPLKTGLEAYTFEVDPTWLRIVSKYPAEEGYCTKQRIDYYELVNFLAQQLYDRKHREGVSSVIAAASINEIASTFLAFSTKEESTMWVQSEWPNRLIDTCHDDLGVGALFAVCGIDDPDETSFALLTQTFLERKKTSSFITSVLVPFVKASLPQCDIIYWANSAIHGSLKCNKCVLIVDVGTTFATYILTKPDQVSTAVDHQGRLSYWLGRDSPMKSALYEVDAALYQVFDRTRITPEMLLEYAAMPDCSHMPFYDEYLQLMEYCVEKYRSIEMMILCHQHPAVHALYYASNETPESLREYNVDPFLYSANRRLRCENLMVQIISLSYPLPCDPPCRSPSRSFSEKVMLASEKWERWLTLRATPVWRSITGFVCHNPIGQLILGFVFGRALKAMINCVSATLFGVPVEDEPVLVESESAKKNAPGVAHNSTTTAQRKYFETVLHQDWKSEVVNKFCKATYAMRLTYFDDNFVLTHAFAISQHMILINKHSVHSQSVPKTITLSGMGSGVVATVAWSEIKVHRLPDGDERDLVCLEMPARILLSCKKLLNHFNSKKVEGTFKSVSVMRAVPRIVGDLFCLDYMPIGLAVPFPQPLQGRATGLQARGHLVVFGTRASAGDCMLPYLSERNGNPVIEGFHAASGVSDGVFLVPFYKEDVEFFRSLAVARVELRPDPVYIVAHQMSTATMEEIKNRIPPRTHYVGKVLNPKSPYGQTELRTSVFNEHRLITGEKVPALFPCDKAPALLLPRSVNGVVVDPLQNAYSKFALATAPPPRNFMARAITHPVKHFLPFFGFPEWPLFFQTPELLSWSQCIYGDDDYDKIDLSTANGYRLRTMGLKKKDLEPGSETERRVFCELDRLDLAARAGVGYLPINEDCLKDELRGLDRVVSGKTRLFNVTDFFDQILARKYTGWAIRQLKLIGAMSMSKVGITPGTLEWALTSQLFGSKVVAGDIAANDMTIPAQQGEVVLSFLRLLTGFEEGSPNHNALETVVRGCSHALHLSSGLVYRAYGGNSSGNYLTTLFNTVANYDQHRSIFKFLRKQEGDVESRFRKDVRLILYSDDNQSESSCPWWNMPNVARGFRILFDMNYTMPDKSDVQDNWLDLVDSSFLSRQFVPSDAARSPLDIDSIHGMLMYYRRNPILTPVESMCMRVECAFRELAHHDKTRYSAYRALVKTRMVQCGIRHDIPSWEQAQFIRESSVCK